MKPLDSSSKETKNRSENPEGLLGTLGSQKSFQA